MPVTYPRRPRPRARLRLAAGIAAAAVLSTSLVGWAASERYLGEITWVDAFGASGDRPEQGAGLTLLLVGSDDRAGLSRQDMARLHTGHLDFGQHTDTIMLLHISADAGQLSVVSIPRDSLVTIPSWTDDQGVAQPARQAKINSAFGAGGPKLTVATVEKATGIRLDHYVEVNFRGFLDMVDALGGVEVCLPKAIKEAKSGLDLPAGRQTVSGPQALAYVRMRYLDSDFGRAARQQKFLAAMAQQVTSKGVLLNPLRLNSFLDSLLSSVKTDETFNRDDLITLAGRLATVNMKQISFLTVPVADGNHRVSGLGSTVLWDPVKAPALFTDLREDRPLGSAPAKAPAASPGTSSDATVAPGKIRIRVRNAAGVTGLGKRATDDLAKVGFAIAGPATNASTTGATTTTVRYDPGYDVSLRTVLAAIPGAKATAVNGLGRTFQIDVGSGWAGATAVQLSAAASASAAPTPTSRNAVPAKVRSAADDICG